MLLCKDNVSGGEITHWQGILKSCIVSGGRVMLAMTVSTWSLWPFFWGLCGDLQLEGPSKPFSTNLCCVSLYLSALISYSSLQFNILSFYLPKCSLVSGELSFSWLTVQLCSAESTWHTDGCGATQHLGLMSSQHPLLHVLHRGNTSTLSANWKKM